MAAPAESSNTQLAPGIEAHTECGWKGGDRDSAARSTGGGSKDFFLSLDRRSFVREAAATVKALRFASTAGAARRARPGLRPMPPKGFHHPIKGKKKSHSGLDVVGPSHGRPARIGRGRRRADWSEGRYPSLELPFERSVVLNPSFHSWCVFTVGERMANAIV